MRFTHVHGALDHLIPLDAVVTEVTHGACIDTALFPLQLSDELHGTVGYVSCAPDLA